VTSPQAPIRAADNTSALISEEYQNPYRYHYYFAAQAQQGLSTATDSEKNVHYTTQTTAAIEGRDIGNDQYRRAFAGVASAPISVGILLPLSGKDAALGQALLNSAMLALHDIRPDAVALRVYDTRGTIDGTALATHSAVNDNVSLILGPIFARNVMTVKPIASRAGIPVIAFSNDSNVASSESYILGLLPEDQIRQVMYTAIEKGKKRFAALVPDNSLGDAVTQAMYTVSRETGAQIVSVERFQSGIDPITDSVRRLSGRIVTGKNYAVDALVIPATGNDLRTIAPLLPYFNIDTKKVTLLGTAAWENQAVLAEPLLRGSWFAAPSPEKRRRFDASYRASFGDTPPRLASLAYDATALASVIGHNARGDFSRERLQDANGFAGIDGIFRFLPNGTAERGLAVLQVGRDGFTQLEPAADRFSRPIYRSSTLPF
jgi:ABC-type branched-subunit amino acid transport system substrate-binding protein